MLGGGYRLSRDGTERITVHETQGAARAMNIISKMVRFLASLASQNALWAINHSRSWYSYPAPAKRITGHAKINRAAKKRRARK